MVDITLFRKRMKQPPRCTFCGADLFEGEECVVDQDPFHVYCLECGLRAAERETILTKERIKSFEGNIIYDKNEIDRLKKIVYREQVAQRAKIQELIIDKK